MTTPSGPPRRGPSRPASTGSPGARNGVVATAITAEARPTRRASDRRSAGSSSASRAAGNAASTPNTPGSGIAEPATTPRSVPAFQNVDEQDAARPVGPAGAGTAPPRSWRTPPTSSMRRCAPSTLAGQRSPTTFATASPNGRCRRLSSRPPATAATGLPPAAMIGHREELRPTREDQQRHRDRDQQRHARRRGERPERHPDDADRDRQRQRVAHVIPSLFDLTNARPLQ